MIELIGTISTLVLVAGVLLNNRRKRLCFVFWFAAALLTFGIHLAADIWSLAFRDAILALLAVEGWSRWRRRPFTERRMQQLLAREREMRKRAVAAAQGQINIVDKKNAAAYKDYWTAVAQLRRCIHGRN